MRPAWEIVEGSLPVLATALHNGHDLSSSVAARIKLRQQERLREEDPYTAAWTIVSDTRIIVHRSRFETDLNRPREKCVYLTPADAWGLDVWNEPPENALLSALLRSYDQFYFDLQGLLRRMEKRLGAFVVLDLHSYNYRRAGPQEPEADPALNPEVNIGTGSANRVRWAGIIDGFREDLLKADFLGRHLDVRENVKFQGGYMSAWIHENFPETGLCLAIEFKKFFMDEWTGKAYPDQLQAISRVINISIPGLIARLKHV